MTRTLMQVVFRLLMQEGDTLQVSCRASLPTMSVLL